VILPYSIYSLLTQLMKDLKMLMS